MHAAWRRQLKYWHPDRGNHPDALEHAKLINLAHDVLTNSTKRAAYDRQRAAVGWRPSASAPSYSRPVQWTTVSREGPRRAPKGFDRHGFVARLEEMMNRGRLMIEKRKDLASASKWEAQTQALLRDELGDHAAVQVDVMPVPVTAASAGRGFPVHGRSPARAASRGRAGVSDGDGHCAGDGGAGNQGPSVPAVT